jgi:hypothetical protein
MALAFRSGRPIVLALTMVIVGAAVPAQGQTLQWVRQFGTATFDRAAAVTTDRTGNVYVGGVTRGALPTQASAGNDDAFVARYDASGNVVWFRQFGSPGYDGVVEEATDGAGYIYAAGYINGENSIRGTTGLLAKYDAAGNQQWLRQFGTPGFSTTAFAVDADAAGNVYVLSTEFSLELPRPFLLKYSASGEQLWSRALLPSVAARRLATDVAGHIYVVGAGSLTGEGAADAVITQYDQLGNQLWVRQFGTPSFEIPQGVATNALGDVYVVGLQDGYDLEASFLAQYDSAGNQNWVRTFTAGDFAPWAQSVAADATGNAYVGGFVFAAFPGQTSAGDFDAFVLQYDRAGTQQWVRQFGTPAFDEVKDIAVDDAANIYAAGSTSGAFAGETAPGGVDPIVARLVTAPVNVGERIAEARTALAAMSIADGLRRSLDQKLASAQQSAEDGKMHATCGPLSAFANEVSAQDRKALTSEQAALLRNSISMARAAAGCR